MFNLDEIKRKMLVKYPFFGSIISNVTFKETKGVNTAATDGEVIVYNEDFMNSLPIDDQIFVLAHEVMHIAFNHIKRGKDKNHEVWNIATDAVINAFLKKDGFDVREDFVYYEDAIDYNAEQYYEKLMKDYKDKQNEQNQNNGNQNNSDGNDSMSNEHSNSSHEYWYKPFDKEIKKDIEKASKEESKEKSETSSNGEEQDDKGKKEELEKAADEISKKDEKEAFDENKKQKKEALKKLRDELVKQSQAGNTTTSDIIEPLDIGEATKYIDWRLLLKEAVNLDVDWSYENATIEEGVTPHIEEIMKPEAEIVLDTSYSINKQLLINFLKECKNIISTSRVKVGCFDTKFYGFQEVRNEKEIEKLEFRGGGGTNFNVAVNAFSKRVENKIIFTDGEASMPDKNIDAIWVVFGNKKIKPKGGRVIYIDEEQLNNLKIAKKVFKG